MTFSASVSLSVVTLITMHFRSRSSLSVWTWGSISLPLGAWISCGITSRTRSPAFTRSPSINSCPKPSGIRRVRAAFISSIPSFLAALAITSSKLPAFFDTPGFKVSQSQSMHSDVLSPIRSVLFNTTSTGVFLFLNSSIHFFSSVNTSPNFNVFTSLLFEID